MFDALFAIMVFCWTKRRVERLLMISVLVFPPWSFSVSPVNPSDSVLVVSSLGYAPIFRLPQVNRNAQYWTTPAAAKVVVTRTINFDKVVFTEYFPIIAICWIVRLLQKFVMEFIQLRRMARGNCPFCGYDLKESPDRCPECGKGKESWTELPTLETAPAWIKKIGSRGAM